MEENKFDHKNYFAFLIPAGIARNEHGDPVIAYRFFVETVPPYKLHQVVYSDGDEFLKTNPNIKEISKMQYGEISQAQGKVKEKLITAVFLSPYNHNQQTQTVNPTGKK